MVKILKGCCQSVVFVSDFQERPPSRGVGFCPDNAQLLSLVAEANGPVKLDRHGVECYAVEWMVLSGATMKLTSAPDYTCPPRVSRAH